jgi:hypothetical protein
MKIQDIELYDRGVKQARLDVLDTIGQKGISIHIA